MKINTSIYTDQSFNKAHSATQTDSLNKHASFANLLNNLNQAAEYQPQSAVGLLTQNLPFSEQSKALYNTAKDKASERVDDTLSDRERSIDTYKETMIEIMEMPIDVEILPSEINEALIFNNLGINYLDYKELKVRMEMLSLTEQDIDEDSALHRSDKEKLRNMTADLSAQLQLQLDDLQAGKDKPDEENQRLNFSNQINTQFEDLGLNDVDKFDLLKRMV
ncbi:hypothetical protein C1E23_17630 [Pseudoalteromonas phenolica]|uniref:Uncharacterized protein n=1 Tax=Pseudoalteromonas phenolica TaxID=161398 RepID=A0A4V2EJB9_9GAMM|nr:hypothetical protein [Pseudoalteromonas phenolica]RZQ51808.1 hypothetical protein C1E23_17630 [Pseudoalteromonas phenolica]